MEIEIVSSLSMVRESQGLHHNVYSNMNIKEIKSFLSFGIILWHWYLTNDFKSRHYLKAANILELESLRSSLLLITVSTEIQKVHVFF